MRRLLLVLAAIAFSAAAVAQPRSAGVRLGYYMDAVYQHDIARRMFVDASVGTSVLGDFRLSSSVNGIFYSFDIPEADFNLYWSAGIATGYMTDRYDVNRTEGFGFEVYDRMLSHGFVFGFTPGLGLECNLDIPLQLSVEIRPVIGFHVGQYYSGATVNFYNYGMYGFIPSFSARYRF